jgi:ribosome biogenesis protein NSA1
MTCVTGDDTGLVKVWDITRHAGSTLKWQYGEQTRKRGIASMCWVDRTTTQLLVSMNDGSVSMLDLPKQTMLSAVSFGATASTASSLGVVRDRFVMISKEGDLVIAPIEEVVKTSSLSPGTGSSVARSSLAVGGTHAVHIHRRFGLAAVGGRDNDLKIFDLVGDGSRREPLFACQNVRDHVLDVPVPVFVTGCAIVSPFVFCTSTAYHQVRFYDRRASTRPVQEFEIDREIQRRPTTLIQWNSNKFLIGEASGDVHLYDTRRGFASRAKLRGGVGSVRQMTKHPQGHQILAVAGLDRKARLFHVPTGKLVMSMYTKQKATCVLLDQGLPMADNTGVFSGVVNSKQPKKADILGDDVWDDMEPIIDEFEGEKKRSRE